MHFTFISEDSYPDIHASAIRNSLLSRGLTEHGHTVTFLVLSPQNWEGKKSLDYFGVQFLELNSYNGTNKFLKYYHYLSALNRAKKILKHQKKQNKIDALVIFNMLSIHIFPMTFFVKKARRMNISVFHERTELPYVFGINEKVLAIYERKLLPQFDGLFVISDKLNSYMQQFNPSTQKLLTVADLSFFNNKKPSPYPFPYIGYCGNISGNKDGVPILIEAFTKIAGRFPELRLVLVGNNANKEAIKETLDAITHFNITDKVIFTGLVEREMMPVILCNAQILVVAKPDNEQNSANFPIKVGEYLATGVPVVVTKVGEIPLFIKDGESGFLAIPGSSESFAKKMEAALEDQQNAEKVGQKGKEIATTFFDYKIQAKKMADYIAGINRHG